MSADSQLSELSNKENQAPSTPSTLASLKAEGKRVVFSPLPPNESSKTEALSFPRKGVLKSSFSSSPMSSPIYEHENPLEDSSAGFIVVSAIKTLGGTDQSAKLDAYNTLLTLFKTYDKLPSKRDLLGKANALFDRILEDLMLPIATPDLVSADNDKQTPLSAKALKLAGFMLYNHDICFTISSKRTRQLFDFTIEKMENQTRKKSTASSILWLWHTQRMPRQSFPSSVAHRMLKVVSTCEYPSTAVQQERMLVVSRLLEQAPDVLAASPERWVPMMLNFMIEWNRSLRVAALRVLKAASLEFLTTQSVGLAVQAHLKSAIYAAAESRPEVLYIKEAERRFKHFFLRELEGDRMVGESWACVCTLLASVNPERGPLMAGWLSILSLLFNRQGSGGKAIAQTAWIRLIHVFALHGPLLYKEKNITYLRRPVLSILSVGSSYKKAYEAALNTTNALLYALMTACPTIDKLTVWESLVMPVADSLLMTDCQVNGGEHDTFCALLTDLLTPASPSETRQLSQLLTATSFPTHSLTGFFTPKWVRSNIITVAALARRCSLLHISDARKIALFEALASSIKEATAKEVQVKEETLFAMAELCRLAHTQAVTSVNSIGGSVWRKSELYASLLLIATKLAGSRVFLEKAFISPATDQVTVDSSVQEPEILLVQVYKKYTAITDQEKINRDDYFAGLHKVLNAAVLEEKPLKRGLNALIACSASLPSSEGCKSRAWCAIAQTFRKRLDAAWKESKAVNTCATPSPSSRPCGVFDAEVAACCQKMIETAPIPHKIRFARGETYEEWLQLWELCCMVSHDEGRYDLAITHLLQPVVAGHAITVASAQYVLDSGILQNLLTSLSSYWDMQLPCQPNVRSGTEVRQMQEVLLKLSMHALIVKEADYKERGLRLDGWEHRARESFKSAVIGFLKVCDITKVADHVALLANMRPSSSCQDVVSVHDVLTHHLGVADLQAEDAHERFLPVFLAYTQFPETCESLRLAARELWKTHFAPRLQGTSWLRVQSEEVRQQMQFYEPQIVESEEAVPTPAEVNHDIVPLEVEVDRQPTPEDEVMEEATVAEEPEVSMLPSEKVPEKTSPTRVASLRIGGSPAASISSPGRQRVMVIPGWRERTPAAIQSFDRMSQSLSQGPASQESTRSNLSQGESPSRRKPRLMRRLTVDLMDQDVAPEDDIGVLHDDTKSPKLKRTRKRSRDASQTPQRKRARRADTDVQQTLETSTTKRTEPPTPESPADKSFAMHKRKDTSLQDRLDSDPVSESSPSVYSRIRRPSVDPTTNSRGSASPALRMAELRKEAKSLSPEPMDELVILSEVGSHKGSPAPMQAQETLAEASAETINEDTDTDSRPLIEQQELDDEDLFVKQLQHYRTSLEVRDPTSTADEAHRAKLGLIMREINRLHTVVTDAFLA